MITLKIKERRRERKLLQFKFYHLKREILTKNSGEIINFLTAIIKEERNAENVVGAEN